MGTRANPLPRAVASAAMALPMKKAVMKKAAAMKKAGMKKAGAMKVMKAKKVSVIARGRGARARVLSGKKQKTGTGLTKDKLMRNKAGKVVSKKASAHGKKQWLKNG